MNLLLRFITCLLCVSILRCETDPTIEHAFNQQSVKEFDKIIDNWSREYNSKTINELNGLTKLGYQLYVEFYEQNDYFKKEINDTSSLYFGNKYFVVQNNLIIFQCKNPASATSDTLNILTKLKIYDFKPPLTNCDLEVLYLTDKYLSIFSNFLMGTTGNSGEIILNRDKYNEVFKRIKFLSSKFSILANDWFSYNYWIIETLPRIISISFNEDLTEAFISYTNEHNWGEAKFILNANKKWHMVYSKIIGG